MKVLKIKENKDGSASVTVSITKTEENFLLKFALEKIISDEVKKLTRRKK
jgi:hypothetical protein